MADQFALIRQLEIFDGWIALIDPAVARIPAQAEIIFAVNGGYEKFKQDHRKRIVDSAVLSSNAQLAGLWTTLLGKTNLVNSQAGTSITRNATTGEWEDAAPPPPAVEPVAVSFGPPPTPEQEAAFGPGVITDPQKIADLRAADALGQTSALMPMAVPETSPAPAPIANIPTSLVSSQAQTIQPPGTFTEVAQEQKTGVGSEINQVRAMAAGTFDPSFTASLSTGLAQPGGLGVPLSGPPIRAGFGFDLPGAIAGAAGTLLTGGNAGAIIQGGLQGGLTNLGPTVPAGTPGIAANGNGGPDLTELLKALAALVIPGGDVIGEIGAAGDAVLNTGAQALGFQSQAQTTFPVNGALATAGLPMSPVLNARQTICYRAPKGYVVVDLPGSNGQTSKVAMWKPMARSLKLWKARPKPPIKASEWKAVKTAKRVQGKAKRIAMDSGFTCRLK